MTKPTPIHRLVGADERELATWTLVVEDESSLGLGADRAVAVVDSLGTTLGKGLVLDKAGLARRHGKGLRAAVGDGDGVTDLDRRSEDVSRADGDAVTEVEPLQPSRRTILFSRRSDMLSRFFWTFFGSSTSSLEVLDMGSMAAINLPHNIEGRGDGVVASRLVEDTLQGATLDVLVLLGLGQLEEGDAVGAAINRDLDVAAGVVIGEEVVQRAGVDVYRGDVDGRARGAGARAGLPDSLDGGISAACKGREGEEGLGHGEVEVEVDDCTPY
ncbi:hypothetical protein N7461_008763 [Penicillium sp. DV-2018c]|nr:hypothetical protein N7461_008763 [Penicillium sp. DV-2018c]